MNKRFMPLLIVSVRSGTVIICDVRGGGNHTHSALWNECVNFYIIIWMSFLFFNKLCYSFCNIFAIHPQHEMHCDSCTLFGLKIDLIAYTGILFLLFDCEGHKQRQFHPNLQLPVV